MIALNISGAGLFPEGRIPIIKQADPDHLLNEVVEGVDYYDFESFWYVALQAFEKKTSKALYDYIDYDNFKTTESGYPQFEFTWQGEDPESMRKICPKLFDKFQDSE